MHMCARLFTYAREYRKLLNAIDHPEHVLNLRLLRVTRGAGVN